MANETYCEDSDITALMDMTLSGSTNRTWDGGDITTPSLAALRGFYKREIDASPIARLYDMSKMSIPAENPLRNLEAMLVCQSILNKDREPLEEGQTKTTHFLKSLQGYWERILRMELVLSVDGDEEYAMTDAGKSLWETQKYQGTPMVMGVPVSRYDNTGGLRSRYKYTEASKMFPRTEWDVFNVFFDETAMSRLSRYSAISFPFVRAA